MAGMCEPKCEPDARLVQALVEAADGFCQEEEQAVSEPSLDLASLQLPIAFRPFYSLFWLRLSA